MTTLAEMKQMVFEKKMSIKHFKERIINIQSNIMTVNNQIPRCSQAAKDTKQTELVNLQNEYDETINVALELFPNNEKFISLEKYNKKRLDNLPDVLTNAIQSSIKNNDTSWHTIYKKYVITIEQKYCVITYIKLYFANEFFATTESERGQDFIYSTLDFIGKSDKELLNLIKTPEFESLPNNIESPYTSESFQKE